MATDTIFALSSGAPPAAIAVVRISGPDAGSALAALAGRLPVARRATLLSLRDAYHGDLLDRTMVLWLPGPGTATGEDSVELHLHGGRAIVAAVEAALSRLPGLRRAEPGEFTRRAFANGRIDLAEAEGLADLLIAETELQRRTAQAMASGALSHAVNDWRSSLLGLSARLEAALDFSDEDDVGEGMSTLPDGFAEGCAALAHAIGEWLDRPRAEPLRDGLRVVLAGPPNAGKSTLFNALVEAEAAITAPEAGTTRDVLVRSVALEGIPFTFVDTAGLRDEGAAAVELQGIERARAEAARADLVLWLGEQKAGPTGVSVWEIEAQVDRVDKMQKPKPNPLFRVSAVTGEGMHDLRRALIEHARTFMPKAGQAALNARQHALLSEAAGSLISARNQSDPLLAAEELRLSRRAFDALIGHTGTEDMLDALFGRFCIGK